MADTDQVTSEPTATDPHAAFTAWSETQAADTPAEPAVEPSASAVAPEAAEPSEDPAVSADSEAPVAPEPKRKGRHGGRQQERIDELTREREDAKRLWMAEQAKNAELQAQLQQRQAQPVQTPVDPNEPNLQQFLDAGRSYDEWVRASARYEAKRELEQFQRAQWQAAQQAQADQRHQTFLSRVEEFRQHHPDYDDVMARSADESDGLTEIMRDVILAEPEGPAMAYFLGSHPEEIERIANLPTGPQVYALGLLAAQVSEKAPTRQASASPTPPVSKAPAPHTPVGDGHANSSAAADLPLADYIRTENAKLAQAGRRV